MQAVRWLHRKGAVILTYHKFPPDQSILMHQCEYLRKHYEVISLQRLSGILRNGDPLPPRAVVITVDDGHSSFYRHGYPVFARFGFPVTVHLTTGPLDSRGWFWFDHVEHAFLTSPRQMVDLPNPSIAPGALTNGQSTSHPVQLGSREQRSALAEEYMERLKLVPNKNIPFCLGELDRSLAVCVPDEAPQEWAALTWDEVRQMAQNNVAFGAHSVTHPILTQIDEQHQLCQEITVCKKRIEAELAKPVLDFAYPNGQPRDISPSIVKTVREAGYETAVTTISGQVFNNDDTFLLKRISGGCELPSYQFRQHVAAFRT